MSDAKKLRRFGSCRCADCKWLGDVHERIEGWYYCNFFNQIDSVGIDVDASASIIVNGDFGCVYFEPMRREEGIQLFLENGERASLWDICQWWCQTYPEDIFVNDPPLIVKIRDLTKELLTFKKGTDNAEEA